MALDAIKDAIQKIADFFKWLLDELDNLKDIVEGWWDKLLDRIRGAVEDAWDYAWLDWVNFIDEISQPIDQLGRWVDEHLAALGVTLEDAYNDAVQFAGNLLAQLLELEDTIDQALAGLGSDLASTLSGAARDAVSRVEAVTRETLGELRDALHAAGDKLGAAVAGLVVDMAEHMDKAIEKGLEYISSLLSEAELDASGVPAETALAASYAGGGQLHEFYGTLRDILSWPGRVLYESIIKWLEYAPPATPEKAKAAIGRYIETVLSLTTIPQLIAKIPDLVEPFKNWGVDRIIQNVYWSLGLGWLSWIVFAEPFRAIIADPLSEYYRALYKTAPTPRSLIDEMYKRYKMGDEEYARWLSQLGYRDELIEMFKQTARNPATDSALKHALETGGLTRDELVEHLKDKGYTEEALALQAQYLLDEALHKERELTYSQILRGYSLGLIGRDTAVKLLEDLGYSSDRAELLLNIEDAEQQLQLRELNVKIILEDLKDGVIDRDTAVQRLVELGVPQRKAELLADLTLARKRTEPRERITKADVRLLLREGLIKEEEAKQYLVSLGYAEPVAEMLIAAWRAEWMEEPRRLTYSMIVKAYRLGLVDRSTALSLLRELGYTEEEADLILRIEEAEEERELQELRVKAVLEDLKDGYITREEALRRLRELGLDPARAAALVELELARARVERRQAPTLSAIREFYVNGLIDRDTAVTWLGYLGYRPELAELFVKLWDMRSEPSPRDLTRGMIVEAYRLGLLDYEQAKNYLIEIGYSEDAARLILDIETARERQEMVSERAENILLAYRYGLIDRRTALDELVRAGVAVTRAEILLEREDIRRERPREPRRVTATQVLRACRLGIITRDQADAWLRELGYAVEKDRLLLLALYCPEAGQA